MSYSDDLDWLARNAKSLQLGKWVRRAFGFDGSGGMKSDGIQVVDDGDPILASGFWHSSDGVIARRAELQNKPSWAHAPEWAQWLVQDEDGVWYWHGKQPKPKGETVNGEKYWMSCGESMPDGRGELLGDWRDMLDRRPADLSEAAVTERLGEATQNVLAAAPGLMDEKYRFDSKNWHERGALPSVGTKCEYRLSTTSPWYPCEIKYVIHDDGVVMMREDGFEQFCSINSKLQPVSFRPIRTERDELMDIIVAQGFLSRDGIVSGEIADAILAAGFKREWGEQ